MGIGIKSHSIFSTSVVSHSRRLPCSECGGIGCALKVNWLSITPYEGYAAGSRRATFCLLHPNFPSVVEIVAEIIQINDRNVDKGFLTISAAMSGSTYQDDHDVTSFYCEGNQPGSRSHPGSHSFKSEQHRL